MRNYWVPKIKSHLKIAGVSDFNFIKNVMYNEEIKEKERYGFDFPRRFRTYTILHLLRRLSRLFLKKEIVMLAIEDEGEIVGGLVVSINYSEKAASIGHVSIAEECRGKGLGTSMIRETIQYLKNRNVKRIELSTDIKNEAAKRVYSRNGFRLCGIIYQILGKRFFRYGEDDVFRRTLHRLLLSERRISHEDRNIKIWWVKTNKGWNTFIQSEIDEENSINQMIRRETLDFKNVRKEVVFSYCFQ